MTDDQAPWGQNVEVVTETIGSVTVESTRPLEWESAIGGGFRHRYSSSPGVFLVGYGARRAFEFEEVVEGFYDFATHWVPAAGLRYSHLPDRNFPVLLGWEERPDVVVTFNSSATDAPNTHLAAPQVRRSWLGWSPSKEAAPAEPARRAPSLQQTLIDLFTEFCTERFARDEETEFDDRLVKVIQGGGKSALKDLLEVLMEGDIATRGAASRTATLVARDERLGSPVGRLEFLTMLLGHKRPSIRDAAALGLYDMKTGDALPPLRRAADKEPLPLVKKNMLQVIEALERRAS